MLQDTEAADHGSLGDADVFVGGRGEIIPEVTFWWAKESFPEAIAVPGGGFGAAEEGKCGGYRKRKVEGLGGFIGSRQGAISGINDKRMCTVGREVIICVFFLTELTLRKVLIGVPLMEERAEPASVVVSAYAGRRLICSHDCSSEPVCGGDPEGL